MELAGGVTGEPLQGSEESPYFEREDELRAWGDEFVGTAGEGGEIARNFADFFLTLSQIPYLDQVACLKRVDEAGLPEAGHCDVEQVTRHQVVGFLLSMFEILHSLGWHLLSQFVEQSALAMSIFQQLDAEKQALAKRLIFGKILEEALQHSRDNTTSAQSKRSSLEARKTVLEADLERFNTFIQSIVSPQFFQSRASNPWQRHIEAFHADREERGALGRLLSFDGKDRRATEEYQRVFVDADDIMRQLHGVNADLRKVQVEEGKRAEWVAQLENVKQMFVVE